MKNRLTEVFKEDYIVNIADVINDSVKEYEGKRRYLSTGDLNVNIIEKLETVEFDDKPSRANQNVKVNDVIFAKMKDTRKTLIIDTSIEDIIVSTGFFVLRPKEKLDSKYLYFYLNSSNFLNVKDSFCTGATQSALNLQAFKSIKIPVPPIETQKKVVEVLEKAESIIKKRKKAIKLLDELVKSRFIEMFGDPVSNPKRWKMVELAELADIKIGPFGSLLHKEDYISGGHALVNPSHIISENICCDEELSISEEKYQELSAYHLKINDVVLGRRGEMGRCAVVKKAGLLCGTGSLLIRSKGNMSAEIIQKILSFSTYVKKIEDKAVGQTMKNLNVPIVSKLEIPLIPMEVQKQYIDFVNHIDKLKFKMQNSLEEMENNFNSLMQRAFKGELFN